MSGSLARRRVHLAAGVWLRIASHCGHPVTSALRVLLKRPGLLALAGFSLMLGCRDGGLSVLMPGDGLRFAKMNANDFYQCQTGNPRNANCNWISGNLNKTHNVYYENDVIPQKFRLDEAIRHTRVIMEFGFRKGGTVVGNALTGSYNGNYDFMADYDAGTGPNNPCTDALWSFFCSGGNLKVNAGDYLGGVDQEPFITGDVSGLTSTEQDAYAAALARYGAAKRNLLVLNASNVQITSLTFSRSGDVTTARLVFTFEAPAGGSPPNPGHQVGVLFGMHFAYGGDWNQTPDAFWHGASGQSGSPFHTKIVEVRTNIPDLAGGGGPDYSKGKVLNNGAMAINVSGDVVLLPSLRIEKTADAASVNAGDDIGFTITVSNDGLGSATGVTVTDTLPAGSGVAWSIDPANASCSIDTGALGEKILICSNLTIAASGSFSVHVKGTTTGASCGTYDNRAHFSAGGAFGSDGASTEVVACVDLGITKTADDESVSASEDIGFTITVTNDGLGQATSVTVTDTLPAGTGVVWSIDPANASCSINTGALGEKILVCSNLTIAAESSFSVHVKGTTTGGSCGVYDNRAHYAAPNDDKGNASDSTEVLCPDLDIEKTPDEDGDTGYYVSPGGKARFMITVTNNGDGKAFNVVITDGLPSVVAPWTENPNKTECAITGGTALECNIAVLNPGASFSVTVEADVPADALQVPNGPAPQNASIEIDGDLDGTNDWGNAGIDCATGDGCVLDLQSGSTDNSFKGGTKEDTPVPQIVFGSIPPNKSDLRRFFAISERIVDHTWLYLAWERVQAPKGTTNMDFELNQSATLSANGVTPVRTAGDILISYDLDQGGITPTIGFRTWVTAQSAGGQTPAQVCQASNTFPCWDKVTILTGPGGAVEGAVNTGSVTNTVDPTPPNNLDPFTFGEARIDMEAAGIFQQGACVSFGSAFLKSRSSSSFTSDVKDFIAPVEVEATNCEPLDLDNTAYVSADNHGQVSDTGKIEIVEPEE